MENNKLDPMELYKLKKQLEEQKREETKETIKHIKEVLIKELKEEGKLNLNLDQEKILNSVFRYLEQSINTIEDKYNM